MALSSNLMPTLEYKPKAYSNPNYTPPTAQEVASAAPAILTSPLVKKKKKGLISTIESGIGDVGNAIKNGLNAGGYAGAKDLLSIPKIAASIGPNVASAILPKSVYNKNDDILLNKISGYQNSLQNQSNIAMAKNNNATGFNKILGQGANLAGQTPEMLLEFGLPLGKVGTVGSALEKGAAPITNLASKLGTNSVAKVAQAGIKTGAEMGLYGGLKTGLEGGKPNDMLNSAKDSAIGGAILGSGGKVAGDLVKLPTTLKNSKQQGLNQALESKFGTPSNNLDITRTSTNLLGLPSPVEKINSNNTIKPLDNALTSNKNSESTFKASEPITPQKIINTDYSKINDEATLNSHISALENHINSKLPPLDLQQFAKKLEEAKTQLQKVSKFRNNTLSRTTALTDEQKSMLNPNEFDYIPETSKEWQDKALKSVDNNIHDVMSKIESHSAISGGQEAHEAAIVSIRLKEQGEATGNYQPLVNWLKTVSSKTRETARALKGTDTAWEKKSADGAIMDTAKVVDNVEEAAKKSDPKKIERINNQTKQAVSDIENAHKESAKQVTEELFPEDMLANRVSGTLKDSTKNPNPVTDMVNELFKSAKESPLPEKAKAIQRNPVEYLRQAIQNKGEYSDVWEKAKVLLKEKYASDPESSAILDDYFNKGIIPTYSENTLNRSVQTSMKDLQQKLVDIAKSSQGDKQKYLSELTDYLNKNTGATGEDASLLASKIQTRFDELVKDKSNSILKQMFPEAFPDYIKKVSKPNKSMFEKVQELINLGAYDKQSIRDLMKLKEGLPILESNDIKAITEHMNNAKNFTEGSNEYNEQIALAREIMENKVPKTTLGKINSFQTLVMLSSPVTAIRNNLSNGLFRGVTDAKNVIRTGLDVPLSKITGERTATLPNFKAELGGMKKDTKDALFDFTHNIDTRTTDKMELNKNVWDKNGNLFNKTMSNIQRAERLALTDRPFEGAAYADEMARQVKLAKLNGVKFDEAKAIEKSKQEAVYSTFQDDTAFSKMALGAKRGLNNFSGKLLGGNEWGLGDVLLKFAKTPANLTARAVDYTPPVAVARALKAAVQKKGFDQEVFVDQIAKSLTGAGIISAGYALGKMGVINTANGTNANLNALKQKAGLGEFTLNLSGINRKIHGGSAALEKGDLHTSYNWANPTSVLITLGAELAKSKNNIINTGSNMLEASTQGFNSLIEQPMTTSLQTLFGSHDFGKAAVTLGTDIPQTFVPSMVNNFRKIDNQSRETYDPNIFKQGINKAVNRVPVLNQALPKKVDIMGQDKNTMQNNNPANIFLNPAITTRYKPDASTENALNLYNETTNAGILPKLVDKKITINDKVYKLTPKQYNDYQRDLGEMINEIYTNNPGEKSANSQILKAGKKAKSNLYDVLGDKPKKK